MRILSVLRRFATVRRMRRTCFASAALILLLAALVPTFAKAPEDPDANRPSVWGGEATAYGFHGAADRDAGLLPLPNAITANFPDGFTNWDPNTNNARASTYFPGQAANN